MSVFIKEFKHKRYGCNTIRLMAREEYRCINCKKLLLFIDRGELEQEDKIVKSLHRFFCDVLDNLPALSIKIKCSKCKKENEFTVREVSS